MERAAPSLLLVGRMMMSGNFTFSGIHKFGHPSNTQDNMASGNAGAGIGLLGLWPYLCTAELLIFMIPATLIFHTDLPIKHR